MNRFARLAVASLALASAAGAASAANYPLNWLSYSPVPMNTPVPNASVYNLPGVGPVTVTYTIPPAFVHQRSQDPTFFPGSVTSGPDTYSWNTHESFGVTNLSSQPSSWDITFTFPTTLAPNSIILGVLGLGSTTSFGGGDTVATVIQNGTFLGDFNSVNNFGATQFNGGPGLFSLQNSVSGPGGQNPHWNTELGLVLINDPISSLTVRVAQLGGDGVGLNIAYVPAPGACALASLAGLCVIRRRRA